MYLGQVRRTSAHFFCAKKRQHGTAYGSDLAANLSAHGSQEFVSDVSTRSLIPMIPGLTTAPTGPEAIPSFWMWILLVESCTQSLGGLDTSAARLGHCRDPAHPTPKHLRGDGNFRWSSYSSSKRRNQARSLKHADRVAKRKLMAQPEISHALRAVPEEQEFRTDEHFAFGIQASHQLALLQEHSNVFCCSQCGAVNARGSLRLLKSQCDGSGESRRKARRKLERGLMPGAQVPAGAATSFLKCSRIPHAMMLDVLTHRASSIPLVIPTKTCQTFQPLINCKAVCDH